MHVVAGVGEALVIIVRDSLISVILTRIPRIVKILRTARRESLVADRRTVAQAERDGEKRIDGGTSRLRTSDGGHKATTEAMKKATGLFADMVTSSA
jgi:hypothetical protein